MLGDGCGGALAGGRVGLSVPFVEAGAEDPLGLEQFRFEEVLQRVAEHGDLFGADAS